MSEDVNKHDLVTEEDLISIRTQLGRLKFRTSETEAKQLYSDAFGILIDDLDALKPTITEEKDLRPCQNKSKSKNWETSLQEQPKSRKNQKQKE